MSERAELWDLCVAVVNAVTPVFQPKVIEAVQESPPFNGVTNWFVINTGLLAHPDPLTAELIAVRNPYSNPQSFQDGIDALKEAGFLDEKGVATEKAKTNYNKLIDIQNDAITATINLLDNETMQRVADLLERAELHALSLDEPEHPSLSLVVKRPVYGGAPHATYYRIGRLNAFRDDSHLAAWRDLEVNGPAWEALTIIWRGQQDTLAAIAERLQGRQYDEADYAAALDHLIEKGWLQRNDEGVYSLTEIGQQVRDDAEAQTNVYFNPAFSVLSDKEVSELATHLKAIAKTYAPDPEPEV